MAKAQQLDALLWNGRPDNRGRGVGRRNRVKGQRPPSSMEPKPSSWMPYSEVAGWGVIKKVRGVRKKGKRETATRRLLQGATRKSAADCLGSKSATGNLAVGCKREVSCRLPPRQHSKSGSFVAGKEEGRYRRDMGLEVRN